MNNTYGCLVEKKSNFGDIKDEKVLLKDSTVTQNVYTDHKFEERE